MNRLDIGLQNLSHLSYARSRAITAENFTGEKGKGGMATEGTGASPARDLGQGWKVSPSVDIAGQQKFTLADISGSGAIQSMWITALSVVSLRDLILRIYWDGQENPSVEVPLGDFFCCGWEDYAHVNSQPVTVNPGRAFNCYWIMPYRAGARMTLENRSDKTTTVYYQINYVEDDVPEDCAYFHAQFRRVNPTPYKEDYVILDKIRGRGHYVGTYMAWGVNSCGWWGEGEIKFFLDGDKAFPTICGTGTEDYFCGSHNFDIGTACDGHPNAYTPYSTAFSGVPQIIGPDGVYESQQRFGMYRWHIPDPIRFQQDLKVTMQVLGWYRGKDPEVRRYKPLQDDVASTAFWYQTLPTVIFPELGERNYLEI